MRQANRIASVNYVAEERFPGDLVSLNARARSYTAVSAGPCAGRGRAGRAARVGHEQPAAAGIRRFTSALPDTITQRTRDLAEQLTAGEPTMYAKATAIEEYLRQIPYDLEIGRAA